MRRNLLVSLALVGVFAGLLTVSAPAVSNAQARQKGQRRTEQTVTTVLASMTKTLNLTDDQQSKIRPILENHFTQARAIRRDPTLAPQDQKSKVKELQATTLSQIKPILTAGQVATVEAMKGGGARILSAPRQATTPKDELARIDSVVTLTDDQKQKIMPILQTAYTKAAGVRTDATLTAQQKSAQLQELHSASHSQIAAILTPDQQQKWAAYEATQPTPRRRRRPGA